MFLLKNKVIDSQQGASVQSDMRPEDVVCKPHEMSHFSKQQHEIRPVILLY